MRNDNFLLSIAISITLHLALIYFFLFGLPISHKKIFEEQVITFEMLDIGDINNVKTQNKINDTVNETVVEDAKKVLESKTPTHVEEPPVLNPKIVKEEQKPIIQDVKSMPISPTLPKVKELKLEKSTAIPLTKHSKEEISSFLDKLESQQDDALKLEPDKQKDEQNKKIEQSKKEINTEEQVKSETKPADPLNKPTEPVKEKIIPKEVIKPNKNQSTNELESLLKNLEKTSEGNNNKSNKSAVKKGTDKVTATGHSTGSDNLSINEFSLIKRHIQNFWNVPAGAAGAESVLITLYIKFEKDGTVSQVKLKNASCPDVTRSVCQAIADSAIRAVWSASPISNLRPESYDMWQEVNIEFDPSEILR